MKESQKKAMLVFLDKIERAYLKTNQVENVKAVREHRKIIH